MTSIGKLSASLEELSLKKQLPLRQSTDRPVLKYSNSGKPVQLFSGRTGNVSGSSSVPSSPGKASPGKANPGKANSSISYHTRMVSSPFKSKPNSPQNSSQYMNGVTQSTQNASMYKPPPSRTPSNHSITRSNSDPYSRPISAKDVKTDAQPQSILKKSHSGSSLKSMGSSGSLTSIGSGNGGNSPKQSPVKSNSFLRPQSAVIEQVSEKPPTQIKSSDSSTTQNGVNSSSNGAGSPNNNKGVQGTGLETSQAKFEDSVKIAQLKNGIIPGIPSKQTSATELKSVESKPPVAPRPPSGTHAPRPPSGRPVSARPPSASPSRPLSAVRNPNYTPTRPYSEVSNVNSSDGNSSDNDSIKDVTVKNQTGNAGNTSSKKSTVGFKMPETEPTYHMDKLSDTVTYNEVKPSSSNSNTSTSDKSAKSEEVVGKRMPVTRTLTGTVYYRKDSKDEQQIAEYAVRQKGDGAPAKTKHTEGKSDEQERKSSTSSLKPERKQSSGSISRNSSRKTLTDIDESEADEWEDEGEESEFGGPSVGDERMPADGESYDDFDDEDDGIDDMDDDVVDEDDDDSDGYSIASSASRKSSATSLRPKSAKSLNIRPGILSMSRENATLSASNYKSYTKRPTSAALADYELQPALIASLFSNVPPVINFVAEGEKIEQLPWEIRKLLKWRMSPITPNIVKSTIARSGFRATKKNHDWLGCWGKHMKAAGFKSIREYQKLNHFPGSFQIGRKDRLWRNLSKMQVHFGKREFGFFPQTYVLPYDLKLLKRAWEDGGNKHKWIIKPPASARGIGIKVIHKWNQIPRKRPVIVQRYLSRPYLINESKFDMRIYVYITSMDPLRIYVFDDGLARFASSKYSHSMKNLNNKYMHLTNYSINKKNQDYQSNTDENVCQGHKWGLKALWNYMKRKGVNTNQVWENMKDLIIKTIISAEGQINSYIKANVRRRYCAHELFGFDIMLDENLKPWIIEVNISPSLHSNSQLDINIKGQMIKDLHNLAGFQIPNKNDVVPNPNQPVEPSKYDVPNELCVDSKQWTIPLSPDERAKHAYYCQKYQDEQVQQTILDTLTPDDIRFLVETIDEDSRKGGFERVFPSAKSLKYKRFFEQPRYYNLLLDQWVQRYNRIEARGIALLDSYCRQNVHRDCPTSNPNHQWSPPNATPRTLSAPVKHGTNLGTTSPAQLPKLKKKTSSKTGRKIIHSGSSSSLNSLSGSVPHPPNEPRPSGRAS